MRTRCVALVAPVVLLAMASCGQEEKASKPAEPEPTPRLQAVYNTCTGKDVSNIEQDYGKALTIADGGDSLIIETNSYPDDAKGFEDVVCVFRELDTPVRISESVSQTTSMMGRLDNEADGLRYEYSYHPDSGLNMVISEEN